MKWMLFSISQVSCHSIHQSPLLVLDVNNTAILATSYLYNLSTLQLIENLNHTLFYIVLFLLPLSSLSLFIPRSSFILSYPTPISWTFTCYLRSLAFLHFCYFSLTLFCIDFGLELFFAIPSQSLLHLFGLVGTFFDCIFYFEGS
ncbi:hypothetical protein BDQ12DRAFT_262828 [Crucibulum laeve]|uniref:Uncharacterized protein n=1 Tax=Crucibulum laeve TaxID=68775 RepID=A0A5C3LV56_9AGAR|nr:hypothetical protein BDQ12DRAFT_262828 [Crucibulum laeve]